MSILFLKSDAPDSIIHRIYKRARHRRALVFCALCGLMVDVQRILRFRGVNLSAVIDFRAVFC